MRDQIRSECRKVRTTRSVWGLLVGTMLLSGLGHVGHDRDLGLAGPAALTSTCRGS